MRLKLLAISDTHVGEPNSLFFYPVARANLAAQFREAMGLGVDEKIEVEDLVLLGDIMDRTLSSTTQIREQTGALMLSLDSFLKPQKIVYLPGNHDHTVWTRYRRARYGSGSHYVTKPGGELLVDDGDFGNDSAAIAELLVLLFGYPNGAAWKRIAANDYDVAIANPVYARVINGRSYVLTHGTHFRLDVSSPFKLLRALDEAKVLKSLDGPMPLLYRDLDEVGSLDEMERVTAPLVDRLWASAGSDTTPWRDDLWYFLTHVGPRLEHTRDTPWLSQKIHGADLSTGEKIRLLVSSDNDLRSGSLKRWKKYFLLPMLSFLKRYSIPHDQITFVYGDTHEGGFGRYVAEYPGGKSTLNIYNTGSWIVDKRGVHPACHIFAVDETGEEFFVDISFRDVKIGGEPIVEKAFRDEEHLPSRLNDEVKHTISEAINKWFA